MIKKYISVLVFFLLILSTPTPIGEVSAHIDRGEYIVTEEVVLDHLVLIACDEVKHECQPSGWGPYSGEDLRIHTKFSTTGHHVQEALFALPDDRYSGVCKEEYERGKKGDKIVIGKTVFFHVDCSPPEKFNYEIWVWDDDSWDWYEILEEISKDAFGDEGILKGKNGVWGAIPKLAKSVVKVAEEVFGGSHDNEQKAVGVGFDSEHRGAKQFEIDTKLTEGGDLDWEKGDIGSEVYFTIKIEEYKNRPCNIDNYKKTALEYVESLEIETEIQKKLRKHIESTYSKAKKGDLIGTKIEINKAGNYVASIVPDEMSLGDANKYMVYERGFVDWITPKFSTPSGVLSSVGTEVTGEHVIYLDANNNPISYSSKLADGFIDEQISESGGYYLGEPLEKRGSIIGEIPKLKPRPRETEVPGYSPIEEETPPETGITYRTRSMELEEIVPLKDALRRWLEEAETIEEETITLVPEEITYIPCSEVPEVAETPCPPPKEGFYLAGYYKVEHPDEGPAKMVERLGFITPSKDGYEEYIFQDRHTVVCVYEPLKTLEEHVPKLTKEDCPPPKPGFELVGWARVVNHQLLESWCEQEVGKEGYIHVVNRSVVKDCIPLVDEVLTCHYKPVVETLLIPIEEAIRKGLIELEGMGTAYGDIFRLFPTPEAPLGITVKLEPVTTFVPAKEYEEEYQDMVTANLEPRELVFKSSVVIEGYCLDAFKEPPEPGIPYGVGELRDRRQIVDIIRAGEELYLIGEFDQGYMPIEEYKMFVVQQAIWVYRTKGTPEELGREEIKENLFAIMRTIEMRTGKIIPEELKERFFEDVWLDIQAVLQRAKLG